MMLKIAFDCPETFIQSQCNKLNGYMDELMRAMMHFKYRGWP